MLGSWILKTILVDTRIWCILDVHNSRLNNKTDVEIRLTEPAPRKKKGKLQTCKSISCRRQKTQRPHELRSITF